MSGTANESRVIDGVEVTFDSAAIPSWLQAVLNMADDNGNTGLDGPVVVASADQVKPRGHGSRLVEEMNRQALQRAADMQEARRSVGLEDGQ